MKKIFLFIVIAAFMSAACTKEVVSVKKPDVTTEVAFEETEYNLDMRDFAMAVNEAINSNQSFRTLIKEEVNQCFDGDYNVLLSMIVDKKVNNYKVGQDGQMMMTGGSISVKDLLNSSFENAKKEAVAQGNTSIATRGNTAGMSLVDKLTEKYPDLQVAVPVHPEHLDNDKYIPPVVFVPEELDNDLTDLLPALKNDKSFWILAKENPDSACIVINRNERLFDFHTIEKSKPTAPKAVTGKITNFGINLHWGVSVSTKITDFSGTYGYKIYRKIDNGNFKLLYTNNSPFNNSYIDNNIQFNKTYYYYVVSYNNVGESEPVYCNNGEGITIGSIPQSATSFTVNPDGVNKARIRWRFANTENNGTVQISKRTEGNDFGNPFFSAQLPVVGNECLDYNAQAGERMEYRILRDVGYATSDPEYDLLYMPYRDVSKKSSVYIKGVKFSNVRKIESWWRGAPEYVIKGLRVKKNGTKSEGVEEFTTRIDCTKKDGGKNNKWQIVNRQVMSDWQPGFDGTTWYDVLSLYVIELDGGDYLNAISITGKVLEKVYTYKDNNKGKDKNNKYQTDPQKIPVPWGAIIMGVIEIAKNIPDFIKSGDEKIGYVYLNYFDNPNSTFSIPADCADGVFTIEFSDRP